MTAMKVLEDVARQTGFTPEAILQRNRKVELVVARNMVAVRLREMGMSYPKIGVFLGGRDHTTIMNLLSKSFFRGAENNVKGVNQKVFDRNMKALAEHKKRIQARHIREQEKYERLAGYRGKRLPTKEYRYEMYKASARTRGLKFSLSFKRFCDFWQKPCAYCGDPIETIGIDRIDSAKGYIRGNLTACCTWCNTMKGTSQVASFVLHCVKIANKSDKKLSTPQLLH